MLRTPRAIVARSADADESVGREQVVGQREVERRRSLADAASGVVLRAVASAQPATILAARVAGLVALRHAAEMGADADHDQPLRTHLLGGVGDARIVSSRIAQV